MLDCVLIIDLNGRILFANDAAFKLVEASQNDFPKKTANFMDFLSPDTWEKSFEALKLGRDGKNAFLVDYKLITMKKNEKYVEGLGTPIDFKGRNAALVNVRDITERKLAEEKIKESERKLADIIQFYPDATMVIDQHGKVILWNKAIEEMTGIKAENIIGKDNYEYSIPFYGERKPILVDLVIKPEKEIEKEYRNIRREGNILFGENYVPCLKGEPHYLVATAARLHDHKGNLTGTIESIRDVTAQKRMEEALKKSEENYRELVEKARSIILRINRKGEITFFNEYAERFFGYSQQEIVGKNVVGTIVPEWESGGRNLSSLLQNMIERPERYAYVENENICRSGQHVWISWANAFVRESYDETAEILCIGNDITERKNAEEELKRYREHLEELVQGRTEELEREIAEKRKSEEKIRNRACFC